MLIVSGRTTGIEDERNAITPCVSKIRRIAVVVTLTSAVAKAQPMTNA
jgi:hypothetical protein